MLSSLKIKNFRSLEDFQIDKLGRVNLIVGKNNSGKSSVLEALRIYAANANRVLLEEIALGHDETGLSTYQAQGQFDTTLPFEDLFTGRKFFDEDNNILIADLENSEKSLGITHIFFIEKDFDIIDELNEKSTIKRRIPIFPNKLQENEVVLGDGLLITKGKKVSLIDFNNVAPSTKQLNTESKMITPCSFIPTQLIPMDDLAKEWDTIGLTEAEAIVKKSLQIILPEFENLIFVDNPSQAKQRRRLPKVKLSGLSRPVPLNSLGDGMLRILQLVLKIFPAKGGFLLIDEFENGLHYSVQEKVWHLLFELSIELDIQIFTTTHSWDCIESFSKVAVNKKDIDGILFRVGKSARNSDKGKVIATVFDEEQLYNITQSDVEVR
ncbi:AAA family ATPase [Candidatus Venteria ishoeyi]|uniref:AAA family ATPase n=1 Tax=Candidatus Venteria ishoeyi TaxID=1899563 RepID=UPI0025A5412B|nr:ATP-binding protein [Candidatus Venteria ishoeyi]MDM8544954.1 AAA family ATPase [Candidatus Venteria ishoeyi]